MAHDIVLTCLIAPEHKFPAGLDDCVAVTNAVLDNPAAFHVADNGVIGVSGDR